jgi:hypothetical protein
MPDTEGYEALIIGSGKYCQYHRPIAFSLDFWRSHTAW